MSKRRLIWIGSIIGGVMLISWAISLFKDHTFEIIVQSRPSMTKAEFSPVAFGLTKAVRPTQIKVVEAESAKTNKYPRTLWHMVADEKPRSVKGFFYGDDDGMRKYGLVPKITNAPAESLRPGVEYLIMVQTDKARGQTNFTAQPPRVMPTRR